VRGRAKTRKTHTPANSRAAAGAAAINTRAAGPISIWLCLGIVTGATLLAYLPLLTTTTGLLWDDAGHVTSPGLRALDGLWRIWTQIGATQQYYPVVHTAFWLQARLWGDNLTGYHLVNVLLHAGSATLLVAILRRLNVPGSLLAGLLFALHPVQVESVAWIAELKNTLSCVFFLGAALSYLRFDDTRARGAYLAALSLFGLAVLSKSVTATLPVGLLVALWYRRGALDWRRDLLPLVPLLAVGIAAGGLTVWFEHALIGAEGSEFQFGLIERTLIAGRAVCFYAASLVWPANLSFNYPRWTIDASAWWQYLFPIGVVAALAVAWVLRLRGVLAAVLIYCVTLAPALGFVNVYPFRFSFVADHFQYHASVAALALLAAVVTRGAELLRAGRWGLTAAAVAIVIPLALATRTQAFHYIDEPTLYHATITSNPDSWLAHNNLASVLLIGPPIMPELAAEHARTALRLKPEYPEARYNLGLSYEQMRQFDAAIAEYRRLIAGASAETVAAERLAMTHQRIGVCLRATGRTVEAIAEFEQAVSLRPRHAPFEADLAMAYAESGHPELALPHFAQAVELAPDSAQHRTNLGMVLLELGRATDAIPALTAAVKLDPGMAEAFYDLGTAYATLGSFREAEAAYREAARLEPDNARTREALARTVSRIK
jgi:tetratricopeptide (TPR) repeat protein